MGLLDVHLLHLPSIEDSIEAQLAPGLEAEMGRAEEHLQHAWRWEQPAFPSPALPTRRGHSVCSFGRKLLVYGGLAEGERPGGKMGALAVLDPLRRAWAHPRPLGINPRGRKAHDTRCVGGRVFVSGGIGEDGAQLSRKADVHELIVLGGV